MMSGTAGATIRLRRDTAAAWAAANPVLALAEPGLETDTNLIKYGNGVTAWNSLPYASGTFDPEAISSNLIPISNGVYDIGSANLRFRDLYLTGNSLYIGNTVITSSGNTIAINGNVVAEVNDVMSDRGADSNNWNLITTMGFYLVNRNSWAGTTGTPLDSQIFVGTLEVTSSTNAGETSITQIFYPGTTNSNPTVQFNRSNWNGVWTDWYRMLNQEQIVSGGLF
jgi:Major tropism determinant N-terminal domain